MRNSRPNALSLAVAIAISSSIIGTQALAARKLQTKSADILDNGHAEFTQSEVMVRPTLDLDEQPIPKSFTTTYNYRPLKNEDSTLPLSFTETLYGIDGAVSSVDQFETDENGVAQKYTKDLYVGDEGVFRFTHNLAEKELVIEVRGGMTDKDVVRVFRGQSSGILSLEPLTKIAGPGELADVLDIVAVLAGNLGADNHYVPLATIEVEKVAVNGRTFMRLIASGDQPPELQQLDQSLFVNDEALLAAATSAYIQVHVLGEDLQQQALDELLAHCKPIGYVVAGDLQQQVVNERSAHSKPVGHVAYAEDETALYPVPAGYPKLVVAEAPGEIIVFHGQKPNPDDIAFVENLYKLWVEAEGNTPAPATTWIRKDNIKGYQYAIRSRQMVLLEEFVTRHDAGVNKDQPMMLTDEDKLAVRALSYYEFLQQALSSATPAQEANFEFTLEHIRAASSVITPTWLQIQLAKHFSFKPALRDLLINQNFVKGIMGLVPVVDESQLNVFNHDEQFAAKVVSDMARQIVKWERQLQEHLATKSELIRVKNQLKLISETVTTSEEQKLRALQLRQHAEDEIALIRKVVKELEDQSQKLQHEVERIPYLQQQIRDVREEASIAHKTQLAEMLGIDNWDDTQPPEEQIRLIRKKIHEINQSVAAAGQPGPEALKAQLAAIEGQFGITPVDENDLGARCKSIQQYIQNTAEPTDQEASHRLAIVESQLGLVPLNKDDLKARHRTIQRHLELQKMLEQEKKGLTKFQQEVARMPTLIKDIRASLAEIRDDYNTQLANELGIDNWDGSKPPEEKARLIRKGIHEIKRSVAATDAAIEQSREEAVKTKLADIEKQIDITPDNENDLDARYEFIQLCLQEHLLQQTELIDAVVRNRLNNIQRQLGLVPDVDTEPEARCRAIQQHLKQRAAESDQKRFQQLSITKDTKDATGIRARYATLAAVLNIPNFDGKADIDVQQERLLEKIKTINVQIQILNQKLTITDAQKEILHRRIQTIYEQQDLENSHTKARISVLAAIPGLDPGEQNEGIATANLNALESSVYNSLLKNAALEEELKDINTPGHPKAMPEVLRTLSAVGKAMGRKSHFSNNDDVYFQRQVISEDIRLYIREARQQSEKEARFTLQTLEAILKIKSNEVDSKATRLERILTRFDSGDVSNYELSNMDNFLWWESERPDIKKNLERDLNAGLMGDDFVLSGIRDRLKFLVEESDQRAREQQANYLAALEKELNIYPHENPAAKEKRKIFLAKLASDLQIGFADGANLSHQQQALRNKIQELIREQVNEIYDDEDLKRIRNNIIADQLKIENYRGLASTDEQNSLIKAKFEHLNEELFKAGQSEVDERIAAIENELDRQMARLGPKPRFALDRDVAMTKRVIKKAESELSGVHRKLNNIRRKQVVYVSRTDVYPAITDEDEKTLNQAIKQIQIDYDLPAGEEQTTEERVDDIRHFLRGDGTERRDEVLEKLEAAIKNLNLQIHGYVGLMEEDDFFIAITSHTNTNDQDEAGYALGELPLTRQKYSQVNHFLRLHDWKSMEVTLAQREETKVKENLALKKEEHPPSGDIDEEAEALHNNEIAMLKSELEHKSQAVAEAKNALAGLKGTLATTEEAVGLQPDSSDTFEHRVNALRNKQVQLGGDDGTGGKIRQLIQEQADLQAEIETREAGIQRMKEALKAAEEAVESDGGPFQYTPKQAKVLQAIHKFTQQHSLKKQALEAAIGLSEVARKSGGITPLLETFNFDDEFAAIRMQALIGDKLTFKQASRIVEVFRSLKATFPESSPEPVGDQPGNALKEIQILTRRARLELATGAQEYDDEIRGMGKAGIHHVNYEPKDLKSFSEYFATRSASGNRIITLLREGLISKVELENYMKVVREIDGYQTVAEFEHFLAHKHGVNVLLFRANVQMLSDKGVEEFMQSAFTPVTVTATGPAGMKESVAGMKEYAAAVIANYVLDDIAFENGRKTAAFLTHVQDTLTPYANAVGVSESDLIKAIHSTLMQAHAAAVERELNDYWVKPSASLAQIVTWYFSSYKPLLVAHNVLDATMLSLSNMSFLYLLDLTNRGDYTHRMLTPFQHWLERYSDDLDRTRQYGFHSEIEQLSEVGGLLMPLGKAASSVILLKTGSLLFARQHNANPRMYRSIFRLVPEIVKSMTTGQGVQVPLLHRITPEKVKTLASATAGLVLGPVATVGAYAHGLVSGFTYAQTFGFALASSLTFDFFMNDNKMLTQWLGGPLGRSLDKINRWRGVGETEANYVKRTAIATPQRFNETDEEYSKRVKAKDMMHGWTRNENYLQFRERRDRTMRMYEHGWEKYFRENVPQWSFSHADSIPYSCTLGVFFGSGTAATETATVKIALTDQKIEKSDPDQDKNTRNEL